MLEECPENADPGEADRGAGPVGLWRTLYRAGADRLHALFTPMDRWIGRRLTDSTRWHMVAAGWGVAIGVSVLTALIPFIL